MEVGSITRDADHEPHDDERQRFSLYSELPFDSQLPLLLQLEQDCFLIDPTTSYQLLLSAQIGDSSFEARIATDRVLE